MMSPKPPLDEPIDWERQRAFLAVLREGSLSAAARALGVAQPTVRRRVEDLERQLGVALFVRSPQGLTATDAARRLGEPARAMASAAESFVRVASADPAAAVGIVRITASEVIGVEVLPSILAALQDRHPGLVLEVSLTSASEDLLRGAADIAVRMTRPTQKQLLGKRVGAIRLGLHAHRRYLATAGTPTSLADLARFRVIGYERETLGVRALRASGLTLQRESFAYRCDNDLGQLAAIRAGVGVGVCQTAVAARDPHLVHLLPRAFAFALDTWVVTHEDLRGVHRVRLVSDALVAALTAYAK